MKKIVNLLIPVIILAILLSFAGCGSKSDDTPTNAPSANDTPSADAPAADAPAENDKPSEPIHVNIGTYASMSFVGSFDPFGMWANVVSGYGNNMLIYDSLYYIDSNGEWSTRIIESAEWTDDTTFVVQLKDNIFFSNGDQLVGEDVLYSLELRQQSGKRSATYMNFSVEKSSVSDDGLTLTLVAEAPDPAYYDGLDFGIVDKSYVESIGGENIDWFDHTQVVGSGPYSVTEFVPDGYVTYTKRADYWGLAYGYDAAVESYTVTNYTDQSTLAIDLEIGTLDLAIDISINDYDRLSAIDDDNIVTKTIPGNVCFQLVWDSNNNEYLKNAKIREALCHAIDTASLTKAIAGSFGAVADSMFAPGELGYSGGNAYEYDVDYARQLLEEEGIKDGDITLNIVYLAAEPYSSMVEVLQAQLAEVGVGLTMESYDMATFISTSNIPGASDMSIYTMNGGNPSGEPTTHLDYWYSTGMNPIMRRNYDDLLSEAATTLDESKRIELYGELQKLWHDNFDGVPLYEYSNGYAYNSDVFEELNLSSPTVVCLFDAIMK